ncbi:hypothetical protein SERLA73DRAFT_183873 [Serpula lacrymans var. lacrymans S7.3]|uniref:Uncharacterized protein n=2 Tax=Serpula lacrymans var. lacrymans TaxID=341189 RepID=F8Q203_SERL3|nr:uncharacterized protein SERLADRAFT_471273 [Serpula lacrymans var. lacrymans S7.9]EGN97214.1 hypothetical protein SERLA73DRAFT_183873 [Serpula lacrymans var. lacrymans S7.3]EGO22823.1 hypothetical protein SERLADRAFT_471273 [Serpula lacrymans var. lacrymans S7.9]
MEEGSSLCVCVIDLLCDPQAPEALLSHPIIELSILRTWKYGLCADSPSATSTFERLVHRFRSLSTPRAIHLVDLISRTAFIIVLAQYLLYPPAIFYISLGTSAQGPREVFLTIMSAALLFRSPSIRTIPSLLIFLAFILTLPSVPSPGDSSFAIMQMAFISHVLLLLHSSEIPSPLFLCFIKQSLPMATLLFHGLTRIFFPFVLFYLPALIISTFLLSISLADTFFAGYTTLSFQPTPVDTRFAFFCLFILEPLLLIASLGMAAATFHSSASSANDLKGWDRYSKPIGLTARRSLLRAARSYAAPYTFPPPLNLVHILAIRLPRVMLYLFGQEHSVVYAAMGWMERWLWGSCVGTLAVLVSGLWLWGLV